MKRLHPATALIRSRRPGLAAALWLCTAVLAGSAHAQGTQAGAENRSTVRLSPQVRELPLGSSTPSIERSAIEKFLTGNRIIEAEAYEAAPYILASVSGNLVIGAGDEVYLRGEWTHGLGSYDIVRTGRVYTDPLTDEVLGLEAVHLGSVSITVQGDDVSQGVVRNSRLELKPGDRLLPRETGNLQHVFHPTRPEADVEGLVIALLGESSLAAQYDAVVLNLGERDGARVGDVLTIYEAGATVTDPTGKAAALLPGKGIGEVLIYRSFEKLSYGLILSSTQPASSDAIVRGQ